MRTLAQKRHNDWKKAIRKRKIVNEVYKWPEGWYDNLHQYSKNNVGCSCWMCRCKTNNKKPHHRGYYPYMNWSISDKRKLDEMEDQNQELDNE